MLLSSPQRLTWIYLVFQDTPPSCGEYVDPKGIHWHVRNVIREPGVVLREPAPPAWYVEIAADHPAYQLEPGWELRRFFRPDEIALHREYLTNSIRRMRIPGFEFVGVSEDELTLVANFQGVTEASGVPNEIDGMPVVVNFR